MATSVATLDSLPATIRAGDTAIWTRSGGDYKASDGWTVTYVFSDGKNRYTVTAEADGADHKATLKSVIGKNWVPGLYTVAVSADKGGERTTIEDEGRTVFVLENLIDGSAKSTARKIYENLEARLAGRAEEFGDVESSTINGQSIQRMSSDQLHKWLLFYGAKVAAEDRQRVAANGQQTGRFSKVSF